MGTLVASASQADGATTTSGASAFNADDVVTATVVNGATPPNQFCQVQLQLSGDNGATWIKINTQWAGGQPSGTYAIRWELADYIPYLSQYNYSAWNLYRVVFTGNLGAAVTVAAADADPLEMATVTLSGVTATTGGAMGSWVPPGGGPIIITGGCVYCTANSTGAANIGVGVAANTTTAATNLIAASALAAAANTAIPYSTSALILTGAQAVTFTGSATTAGFAGKAYIMYIRP